MHIDSYYDLEAEIHEKLPEDVFLKLKGEFGEYAPTFTTFVLDYLGSNMYTFTRVTSQ